LRGLLLETLTWADAEACLGADNTVVIPLGAACKEHGLHLPLNNDWLLAEYLKQRVLNELENVVVAPTINYHFYPAFIEYPGSVSLRLETARDLIVDICTSLARFGPRHFYVLNTGVSTLKPLKAAGEQLAADRIIMRYTELERLLAPLKHLQEQPGGGHADEVETSIMLYIAPDAVTMSRAVNEFRDGPGRLTRDKNNAEGVLSESGVWGDATLATVEKGRAFTETLVAGILKDISGLRETK
jgi:creatinine amidohydrolase